MKYSNLIEYNYKIYDKYLMSGTIVQNKNLKVNYATLSGTKFLPNIYYIYYTVKILNKIFI